MHIDTAHKMDMEASNNADLMHFLLQMMHFLLQHDNKTVAMMANVELVHDSPR